MSQPQPEASDLYGLVRFGSYSRGDTVGVEVHLLGWTMLVIKYTDFASIEQSSGHLVDLILPN